MKKKWFTTLLGLGIIAVVVLTSAFLVKNKPVPPKNEKRTKVLFVKAEKANYRQHDFQMAYHGRVQTAETVSLSAEVSGKILPGDIPFKEGQTFTKGQLLVRIYHEDALAALRSSRSNFLQLLSSVLPDIKIDFPDAYTQWSAFFNGISMDKDLPELPVFTSEKERVFMASKGVLTQYYAIQQKEITFKKYMLYAPFNGAFKQVNKQVGAVAGMSAELAKLIRTDKLEVVVPVDPKHKAWIKNGMEVSLQNKSGSVVTGKVTRIANFVDPASQSVNIYVAVSGKQAKLLLEGEYVEATFISSESVNAIALPREAILNGESVYVINEGKLHKQNVHVEAYLEDAVLVSGVKEGVQIVSESLIDVSEGYPVKPMQKD